jgi:predicted TIM-barrel fold metal-dependent hydrolase
LESFPIQVTTEKKKNKKQRQPSFWPIFAAYKKDGVPFTFTTDCIQWL